jgi:hypothetical protein
MPLCDAPIQLHAISFAQRISSNIHMSSMQIVQPGGLTALFGPALYSWEWILPPTVIFKPYQDGLSHVRAKRRRCMPGSREPLQ